MCPPYPFIRFHTSLPLLRLLIRAKAWAGKSHNKYIILEDFKMGKYIYDESNGLWYEFRQHKFDRLMKQRATHVGITEKLIAQGRYC